MSDEYEQIGDDPIREEKFNVKDGLEAKVELTKYKGGRYNTTYFVFNGDLIDGGEVVTQASVQSTNKDHFQKKMFDLIEKLIGRYELGWNERRKMSEEESEFVEATKSVQSNLHE